MKGPAVVDLHQLALFRLVSERIGYTSQRQAVLAENVANADTPGYRPNDLEPFSAHLARETHEPLRMAATSPQHLAPAGGAEPVNAEAARDVYEVAPSGNEVVLEQQMMEMGGNARDHQLALNLYRKHAAMIRTALGQSGR
jgi:flagellar basal-body rod protein FlgB